MAKRPRTVYVVVFDDCSANGGGCALGVTSRGAWAEALIQRQNPNWCEWYSAVKFMVDDPKIFPEVLRKKGGSKL